MKRLLTILTAFLLASPALPQETKVDTSAVVKVECSEGSGSAVSLGGGRYASAAHVATLAGCTVGGEPIKNVKQEDGDFATFTGPKRKGIRLNCNGFEDKGEYLAIGYAFGLDTRTYEPLIASKYDIEGFRAFTGETIPGMSGGAVIDSRGRFTGIVNMRWPARSRAISETSLCTISTKR